MGSSNSKKLSPEEMKYLTPTGLYPSCSWDLKTIRKLIMEKKLAPFYPGREEKDAPDLDECPICFMVCCTHLYLIFILAPHLQLSL